MFYKSAAPLLMVVLCSNWALASSFDFNIAKQRCAPAQDGEPKVYAQDFKWGYTFEEMGAHYIEIYSSGKRLAQRAHYDPAKDAFVFPLDKGLNAQTVHLPAGFLANVASHLEEGLKRDYVDYVFFPDIGHSHFFVPQDFYDEEIGPLPISDKAKRYELMMQHPGLKVLYHTAEQLGMKDKETKQLYDSDYLRWRYYTRNLVGFNDGSSRLEIHKKLNEAFNTVHDHEGGSYKHWGAGFYVSASKDGCFPFTTQNGEIHYFDLSLESLPYAPGSSSGADFLKARTKSKRPRL